MSTCLISLGSNVGDRRQTLDRALELLGGHAAVCITARSRWHETNPVGGPPGQGPFLNGAALLETSLEPAQLAAVLFEIETRLGRTRGERWGPRTLDLDLLLCEGRVIETPHLVVPHASMAWRRFVLEPAAEIAPSMVHPIIGWTVARLLDHLNTAASYAAIAGPAGIGKGVLARRLVDESNQRRPGSARLLADPIPPPPQGGGRPDWPSIAFQREVQFLTERARLLQAGSPDWAAPGAWAISDFWLDQSLAYAETSLDAPSRELLRRRNEELAASAVAPKLLVALVLAGDPLTLAIRQLAARPGQGPVLFLKDVHFDRGAEEVLAAIHAME